jgi:hypothetical protein
MDHERGETPTDIWRNLVDRLTAHDICYLTGGSGWEGQESYRGPDDAPLAPLLLDLLRASDARLRNALISLFLRHPEYVARAEVTARKRPADDPGRQLLLVSIVVAAEVQGLSEPGAGGSVGRLL